MPSRITLKTRVSILLFMLLALPGAGAFAADPVTVVERNSRCLACHTAPDSTRSDIYVSITRYAKAVHGELRCIDCHRDLRNASLPHPTKLQKVDCSTCHQAGQKPGAMTAEGKADFADSVHGKALARKDPDAPNCTTCHGNHYILPADNPESNIFRSSIPELCITCHGKSEFIKRHHIAKGNTIEFRNSVHGRAAAQGNVTAAVCTDCHGVHDIRVGTDPRSSVSRPHIPNTCGKCHADTLKAYLTGIHGQAFSRGVKEAPVCTDCHGEHDIRTPKEAKSRVSPFNIVKTCSRCHEDVELARRFRIPAQRLTTYLESYHGIARQFGDVTVADCASCHGAHKILPSSDPRSSIHPNNIPKTCGTCHPGASKNFALGAVHLMPSPTRNREVYWVKVFYQVFVALLVAQFLGYVVLDLFSHWRAQRKQR